MLRTIFVFLAGLGGEEFFCSWIELCGRDYSVYGNSLMYSGDVIGSRIKCWRRYSSSWSTSIGIFGINGSVMLAKSFCSFVGVWLLTKLQVDLV